jgi:hypothetical protein
MPEHHHRAHHPDPDAEHADVTEEELEELDEEAAVRNPDETTRREALELELEEKGISDLGEDIGDEMT